MPSVPVSVSNIAGSLDRREAEQLLTQLLLEWPDIKWPDIDGNAPSDAAQEYVEDMIHKRKLGLYWGMDVDDVLADLEAIFHE